MYRIPISSTSAYRPSSQSQKKKLTPQLERHVEANDDASEKEDRDQENAVDQLDFAAGPAELILEIIRACVSELSFFFSLDLRVLSLPRTNGC